MASFADARLADLPQALRGYSASWDGGMYTSGRWHTKGHPMIYTPALRRSRRLKCWSMLIPSWLQPI